MQRQLKYLLGALIAILFLGSATWFWSLGAAASEAVPAIRVEATKARVEVKTADASEWKEVQTAQELNIGDAVRTDAAGQAQIRWGDRGVTRLDAQSQATIEMLPDEATGITGAAIHFCLNAGRAWSRVLKLFGPQSSFEVKTNDVVATVRGTAFGLVQTASGTDAAVTESVVSIAPLIGGSGMLLKEGKFGSFDATGTLQLLRDLNDSDAWANENHRLDQLFDAQLQQEILERFKQRHLPAPEWLTALSEQAHLAMLSGDARQRLAAAYMLRHLAFAVLANQPNRAHLPSYLGLLKRGLGRELVLDDIRNAMFYLRQPSLFQRSSALWAALTSFRTLLLGVDPQSAAYAKALEIDDRIDDLILPVTPQVQPPETAAQLLADIQGLSGSFSASGDGASGLMDKFAALDERLGGGAENPTQATSSESATTGTPEFPPQVPPAATQPPPHLTALPNIETGQNSPGLTVPPPATSGVTAPAVSACAYQQIKLSASPASGIKVGDAVALTLSGTCQNGTSEDLTSQAAFSSDTAEDGRMVENVFTPAKAGDLVLRATLSLDGKTQTASTVIKVENAARKLLRLDLSAVGTTTLTTGQSMPLHANAVYSDDTTADVTYLCRWSTSDAKLAAVIQQKMQSLSGVGEVTATCTYVEDDVTVFGNLIFNIVLDPQLKPSLSPTYSPTYNQYFLN